MALHHLMFLFIATTFWTCFDCVPLQIHIDDRIGSTSCVGDLVTYTCTVLSIAPHWIISSLDFSEVITRVNPTFGDPASPFSIVTIADEGGANPIATALSVTSFAGLNGANITCGDGNLATFDVQDTIAMVFGPPTAPGLTAVSGGDLVSVNFTITPSVPPDCVVNYTITATSSDVSRNITVPASEVDGSTTVNVGGFNLCARRYSFTVAPVTREGTGPTSASVDRGIPGGVMDGQLVSITVFCSTSNRCLVPWTVIRAGPTDSFCDILTSIKDMITGLQATPTGIEWTTPSGVPVSCFPQYIISLTADPTVTLTVNDTTASSAALNAAGFPFCVSQEITVTPIVAVTNTPLSTSSATAQVIVTDPGIEPPSIGVSNNLLNVTVYWKVTRTTENVDVIIHHTSPDGADQCTLDVATVPMESWQHDMPLDSRYSGTRATFCVQFTSRDCHSSVAMVTTNELPMTTCPKSSSSPTALAVSLPMATLLSLLVGFLLGLLVMWCWNKKSVMKTSGGQTPMYEEVSQGIGVSMQLTTNKAYGHA